MSSVADDLDRLLAVADAELESGYPGYAARRQPVHTVYIPAHSFDAGSVAAWGAQALEVLAAHAPGPEEFALAMGIDPGVAAEIWPLVLAKLASEPVEDLRIDFEDGYGVRGDDTEDAHARAAALAVAAMLGEGAGPPAFIGLRCKSLERQTRRRAIRTLDAFIGALAETGRPMPPGFLVTLPKVTSVAQVTAMVLVLERLESAYGLLVPQRLLLELQVETPQLILGQDGAATVARCVHAGNGRITGLHYGTYDYSAALGIAAAYQSMEHPAADYAKAVMQVAAAATPVSISDGSTSILPTGTHHDVVSAWRLHARLVRRSLERGFYQGWDLHPAQLASRYAATYAFYRDGLSAACARLRDYTGRAATAQEEPATAKALSSYLLRALNCGAVTEMEITTQSSLTRPELDQLARTGQPR